MKNKQMPIGIDNLANFKESKYWPKLGRNLPNKSPITMQMAIHKVRYFSKTPSFASFLAVNVYLL